MPDGIIRNDTQFEEWDEIRKQFTVVKHRNDIKLGKEVVEDEEYEPEEETKEEEKQEVIQDKKSSLAKMSHDLFTIAQSPPETNPLNLPTTPQSTSAPPSLTVSASSSSSTLSPSPPASSPPPPLTTNPSLSSSIASYEQSQNQEKKRFQSLRSRFFGRSKAKDQQLQQQQSQSQSQLPTSISPSLSQSDLLKQQKKQQLLFDEKESQLHWLNNELFIRFNISKRMETKEEKEKRIKINKKLKKLEMKEEIKVMKKEKKRRDKHEKRKAKAVKKQEEKEKAEFSKRASSSSVNASEISSSGTGSTSVSESETESDNDDGSPMSPSTPSSLSSSSNFSSSSSSSFVPFHTSPLASLESLHLSLRQSFALDTLLLYIPLTSSQSAALVSRTDVGIDALVITTQRLIKLKNGKIDVDVKWGVETGCVLQVKERLQDEDEKMLNLIVTPFSNQTTLVPQCLYSFTLPSSSHVSYLSSFLPSMQDFLFFFSSHLHFLSSSLACHMLSDHSHQLTAWSLLTRSLLFPILFSESKLKLYKTLIRSGIGKLEGKLKRGGKVEIDEMRVEEIKLPSPSGMDPKQLPKIKILAYSTTPVSNNTSNAASAATNNPTAATTPVSPSQDPSSYHVDFVVDFSWLASDFLLRLFVRGSKVFSFEVELLLSRLQLSGLIRLRCSPFDLSVLSISFLKAPSISLSIATKIKLGSLDLPFKNKIERYVVEKVQEIMLSILEDVVEEEKWVPIKIQKPPVWEFIERWKKIEKFQFEYDEKDSQEMLELVSQMADDTEMKLEEELKLIREKREKVKKELDRRKLVKIMAASKKK